MPDERKDYIRRSAIVTIVQHSRLLYRFAIYIPRRGAVSPSPADEIDLDDLCDALENEFMSTGDSCVDLCNYKHLSRSSLIK